MEILWYNLLDVDHLIKMKLHWDTGSKVDYDMAPGLKSIISLITHCSHSNAMVYNLFIEPHADTYDNYQARRGTSEGEIVKTSEELVAAYPVIWLFNYIHENKSPNLYCLIGTLHGVEGV